MRTTTRLHDETYCPGCGYQGVVVALDGATLIETRPVIRRHACNVGGPGSAVRCPHDNGGGPCVACGCACPIHNP